MSSRKTFCIAVGLLAAALCCLMIVSCGKKQPDIDPAVFKDWQKYDYGHFSFFVSPKSAYATDMPNLAKNYERFLTEICAMLEMPIPADTINLYVYAIGNEDRELTGRQTPWSDDTQIHWGGKYPCGYELTKYLLRKQGFKTGQFNVINEGIPFLLDFSGHNYHDKANRRVNSGSYIDLATLGDSRKFDSLEFATRRAEAASLCGFIMYNYGNDRLYMLGESSIDWRRSIETIFQMPFEDFEQTWLLFAREQSNDPDGTVEDDPDADLRIIRK